MPNAVCCRQGFDMRGLASSKITLQRQRTRAATFGRCSSNSELTAQLLSVCVLVTQSCLTLCDPMDCSQPGSSVRGILQSRILEWIDIPFSRESSWSGIEPRSPALQADSLHLSHQGSSQCQDMTLQINYVFAKAFCALQEILSTEQISVVNIPNF